MPKFYIYGRKNIACCSLIDHLLDLGVTASIGHDNKRKYATLYVYTDRKRDVSRVPNVWDGYPVVAVWAAIKPSLNTEP